MSSSVFKQTLRFGVVVWCGHCGTLTIISFVMFEAPKSFVLFILCVVFHDFLKPLILTSHWCKYHVMATLYVWVLVILWWLVSLLWVSLTMLTMLVMLMIGWMFVLCEWWTSTYNLNFLGSLHHCSTLTQLLTSTCLRL